jgi:hypothetical protein
MENEEQTERTAQSAEPQEPQAAQPEACPEEATPAEDCPEEGVPAEEGSEEAPQTEECSEEISGAEECSEETSGAEECAEPDAEAGAEDEAEAAGSEEAEHGDFLAPYVGPELRLLIEKRRSGDQPAKKAIHRTLRRILKAENQNMNDYLRQKNDNANLEQYRKRYQLLQLLSLISLLVCAAITICVLVLCFWKPTLLQDRSRDILICSVAVGFAALTWVFSSIATHEVLRMLEVDLVLRALKLPEPEETEAPDAAAEEPEETEALDAAAEEPEETEAPDAAAEEPEETEAPDAAAEEPEEAVSPDAAAEEKAGGNRSARCRCGRTGGNRSARCRCRRTGGSCFAGSRGTGGVGTKRRNGAGAKCGAEPGRVRSASFRRQCDAAQAE